MSPSSQPQPTATPPHPPARGAALLERVKTRRGFAVASFLAAALMTFFGLHLGGDRGPRFSPAAAKTDRGGTYDLAQARTLSRVVGHIRAHYVEPARVAPREMAVAALMAVQRDVPEVIVAIERDRDGAATAADVTVDEARKRFGLERVNDLYELNWKLMDIFDFLERQLPPVVDLEAIEFSAINGLLSTLDPHSLLLSPRTYREMQLGQRGRFGGLGLVVGAEDGVLKVMSVMRGTPAGEADLEPGDDIVQIDAESTINMSLDEAVNLLRGEPGSRVTVWVKREGWAVARPVPLVRREIRVPSVEWEALPDGIGHVAIRSFQDNTVDNLRDALDELKRRKGGLKGLVLDLRDNPGGLLDKAIGVSDAFLQRGTIVTTVREGARERDESHATFGDSLAELPVVVLINRGSASASEIVAGALKGNDRAIVLGERSFGKGSVQVVYKIDEAALKLTIAQYLTPGDVSIQSVGIVPDIEILTLNANADGLDLYPASQDIRGEAGLASHLDSAQTRDERSSVQLRLLGDGVDAAPRRPSREERMSDPLARLARELLVAAPSPKRRQALVQAAGFLARRQAEEDARLVERLLAMGVDWSPGANPARPKLEARIKVRPAQGDALVAGELVKIEAEVDNPGKQSLYRVHGRMVSAIGAIDGVELAFGEVAPGQTVKRTATVRLPKSASAVGDVVRMRVLVGETDLGELGEVAVSAADLPRPLFAHKAQVIDLEGGNGDGLIQRGEVIGLAVKVTNAGPGRAHRVLAAIKNESGQDVFITEGRHELGPMAPGESKVAVFGLKVRDSLKARNVQLKLSIIDQTLKVWAHDDLSVRVFPEGFPAREAREGVVAVGQAALPIRAGAHRDAPEVAEAAPLAVLKLRGAAGEWLEVEWPEPSGLIETGWVAAGRVSVGTEGGVTPNAVTSSYRHRPPLVEMEDPALLTRDKQVVLRGVVKFAGGGEARRHLVVFRGKDKVHFSSARSAEAQRDELPFEVTVALEPGANELTIVAREGQDYETRRQLTVHRR